MSYSISLYNSLSRTVEVFTPADERRITMYVCGPTVYSYAHIGNARSAIVFDVLFRLLKHRYGDEQVVYARNFTDVDDKIIEAAKQSGEPIATITNRYTDIYLNDMGQLNVQRPNSEPRATEHIGNMIDIIERLVDSGYAYAKENHVLFNTPTFEGYGQLSRRKLEDMIAGARIEIAPYKKAATDFVLWKPSKADEIGWESPWGYGRPGWHIECSAMMAAELGESIDIHGGGHDLTFPHHENELAQSSCAFGVDTPVRYWLHNGFVNFDTDKMSKSLGNVVLVNDLLRNYSGEIIRFALMNAHYRSPLAWSDARLQEAKNTLDNWYRILEKFPINDTKQQEEPHQDVLDALADDMNTPLAITKLHAMATKINSDNNTSLVTTFKASARLLGFLAIDANTWFKGNIDANAIDCLIAERLKARQDKDFARADAIRDELDALGIVVEDGADGASWRKK